MRGGGARVDERHLLDVRWVEGAHAYKMGPSPNTHPSPPCPPPVLRPSR